MTEPIGYGLSPKDRKARAADGGGLSESEWEELGRLGKDVAELADAAAMCSLVDRWLVAPSGVWVMSASLDG